MTCRGSRRNTLDKAKNIYEDSPEWLAQNMRSTRNFIRKWGHFVKHDRYMKPIIFPKYDIGFIVKNCTKKLIFGLEPWCNNLYVDSEYTEYIKLEQPNTKFNLKNRIKPYDNEKNNEILVEIDGNIFTQEDAQYIEQLPEILADSVFLEEDMGEQFEVGNLKLTIFNVNTYEKDLIICKPQ